MTELLPAAQKIPRIFSAAQTEDEPTKLQTGLCKPFPFRLFPAYHRRGSAGGLRTIKICCLPQEQLLKHFHLPRAAHAGCPWRWAPAGGLGGGGSGAPALCGYTAGGRWSRLEWKHSINCFPASGHGSPCLQSVPGKVSLSSREGKSKPCQSLSCRQEPLTLLCHDQPLCVLTAQKEAAAQKMACPEAQRDKRPLFFFPFLSFFFQICVCVRQEGLLSWSRSINELTSSDPVVERQTPLLIY